MGFSCGDVVQLCGGDFLIGESCGDGWSAQRLGGTRRSCHVRIVPAPGCPSARLLERAAAVSRAASAGLVHLIDAGACPEGMVYAEPLPEHRSDTLESILAGGVLVKEHSARRIGRAVAAALRTLHQCGEAHGGVGIEGVVVGTGVLALVPPAPLPPVDGPSEDLRGLGRMLTVLLAGSELPLPIRQLATPSPPSAGELLESAWFSVDPDSAGGVGELAVSHAELLRRCSEALSRATQCINTPLPPMPHRAPREHCDRTTTTDASPGEAGCVAAAALVLASAVQPPEPSVPPHRVDRGVSVSPSQCCFETHEGRSRSLGSGGGCSSSPNPRDGVVVVLVDGTHPRQCRDAGTDPTPCPGGEHAAPFGDSMGTVRNDAVWEGAKAKPPLRSPRASPPVSCPSSPSPPRGGGAISPPVSCPSPPRSVTRAAVESSTLPPPDRGDEGVVMAAGRGATRGPQPHPGSTRGWVALPLPRLRATAAAPPLSPVGDPGPALRLSPEAHAAVAGAAAAGAVSAVRPAVVLPVDTLTILNPQLAARPRSAEGGSATADTPHTVHAAGAASTALAGGDAEVWVPFTSPLELPVSVATVHGLRNAAVAQPGTPVSRSVDVHTQRIAAMGSAAAERAAVLTPPSLLPPPDDTAATWESCGYPHVSRLPSATFTTDTPEQPRRQPPRCPLTPPR
eukprot:Hpha_TRINITY_DN7447_c0_g1::TRINITY_DN7447_c0_g1_i1::g.95960::m.95960